VEDREDLGHRWVEESEEEVADEIMIVIKI
jgi:hypothetical protein